jgi:hypothetical protein
MERHIHEQNLAHYRRLLAESESDPSRNEVQHKLAVEAASRCGSRRHQAAKQAALVCIGRLPMPSDASHWHVLPHWHVFVSHGKRHAYCSISRYLKETAQDGLTH